MITEIGIKIIQNAMSIDTNNNGMANNNNNNNKTKKIPSFWQTPFKIITLIMSNKHRRLQVQHGRYNF